MTPDHIPPHIGAHDESVAAVVEHECFTVKATSYLRNLDREDLRAETFAIHYQDAPKRHDNGNTSYSLCFPTFVVAAYVKEPRQIAEKAAAILNRYWDAPSTPDQSALIAQLVEAGDKLLASMFGSYKARNGRDCYIEGDNGERCLIVNSEDVEDFSTALAAARGEG